MHLTGFALKLRAGAGDLQKRSAAIPRENAFMVRQVALFLFIKAGFEILNDKSFVVRVKIFSYQECALGMCRGAARIFLRGGLKLWKQKPWKGKIACDKNSQGKHVICKKKWLYSPRKRGSFQLTCHNKHIKLICAKLVFFRFFPIFVSWFYQHTKGLSWKRQVQTHATPHLQSDPSWILL